MDLLGEFGKGLHDKPHQDSFIIRFIFYRVSCFNMATSDATGSEKLSSTEGLGLYK